MTSHSPLLPAAAAAAVVAPPVGPPLHLTIRFSTSHPDIDLDIPSPQTTTIVSVKYLLRGRLASRSRLRLIHHGRLLPDASALSTVFKLPTYSSSSSSSFLSAARPLAPPPVSPAAAAAAAAAARDVVVVVADPKGKGRAGDGQAEVVRIYVNCSIGDELSQQDLDDERDAASKPPDDAASAAAADAHRSAPPPSTRPRPRGFDRLLQSGFSTSEVATLRTQFASINAERRAPTDPPPSPDTARRLEDAWIDSNAGDLPAGGTTGGGPGTLEDELTGGVATVLDVLIRAMMIGFFFPLGSLTWLLRMGIWNDKWQIFVASGVVLSLSLGIVMGLSGDRT